MTLWCPANKLEWYRVIILSSQFSGTANTAVSLLGVGVIWNNNDSNKMYCSTNVSTILIAALELGNLFVPDRDKCPWNRGCLNTQPVSLLFQPADVCL